MMKRAIFFLVLPFLLISSNEVVAHTSDTSESVSVLMHVEPDDRPLAEQSTILHFQIEDTSHKFSIKNCNCTVTISSNGKKLGVKTVSELTDQKSVYSAYSKVTFDRAGSYRIIFEAKPKNSGTFSTFTTNFELKVGEKIPTPDNDVEIPHVITYLFLAVIGIGTIVLIIRQVLPKKI